MAGYVRKIGLTVFINGFTTLVGLASGYITVRLILSSVGQDDYGLLLLISSVVGFIGFSDFGITTAVSNQISYFFAEKKRTEIAELFSGSTLLMTGIILMVWSILGILFLTKAISVEFIFGIKPVQASTAFSLFFIMLFSSSISVVSGAIFQALFSGLNEIPRYNLINFIFTLINSVAFILFLFFKPTIVGVALFQATALLVRLLLYAIATRIFFNWLKFSLNFFLIKKVFPLLKHSFMFVALSLVNSLIGRTDLLVISHILGTGMITVFSVSDRLLRLPANVLQLADPAAPTIAMEYKKNNFELLAKIYNQVIRMHLVVRLTVLSFVVLYSKQIITIWLGSNMFYGYSLFIALLISFLLYSWVGPHFTFINAMFKHKITFIPMVISASLNLIISILLASRIGLVGVLIGTIVGNAVTTVMYLPWYLKKIIPIQPFSVALKILMRFSVPLIVAIFCYYGSTYITSSIWWQFIFGALNFSLYLFLIFKVVLQVSERKFIIEKIKAFYSRSIPMPKLL